MTSALEADRVARRRAVPGERMADTAALVGEPARANMLALLMDGQSHTATELAVTADITAATASGHLGKMRRAGLIAVGQRGRHRYYRLAGSEVARMLEAILLVSNAGVAASTPTTRVPLSIREARTCYDHLAGRVGVAIANNLLDIGAVSFNTNAAEITESGLILLNSMGITVPKGQGSAHRPLCRPCLDWSERQPHLAGVLGKHLLERLLQLGWMQRIAGSRAISITRAGRRGLNRAFGYT